MLMDPKPSVGSEALREFIESRKGERPAPVRALELRLGCTGVSIRNWMSGRVRPSYFWRVQLRAELGIRLEDWEIPACPRSRRAA
jgi:hypothetical protein